MAVSGSPNRLVALHYTMSTKKTAQGKQDNVLTQSYAS
jgi:hypothetical protein